MKVAVNKETLFYNEAFESTLAFVHHSTRLNGIFLFYTDGQVLKYNTSTGKAEPTSAKVPQSLNRFRIGTLTDTKVWILDGADKKLRIYNLETLKNEVDWQVPSALAKTEGNAGDDAQKLDDLIMDTKIIAIPKHELIVTSERVEKNANEATYIFSSYHQATDATKPAATHRVSNNKNFFHFDVVDEDQIAIYNQEIEPNQAEIPITIWVPVTRKENMIALKNSEKVVGTIVNVKKIIHENGKEHLAFFINNESQDGSRADEALILLNEIGQNTFVKVIKFTNLDPIKKVSVPCLFHTIIHVYSKDHTILAQVIEDDGNKIVLYNYAKDVVLAAFSMDDETDAVFSIIQQTLIQSPQLLADPPRIGAGSHQETPFLTTLFIPKEILSIFYMLNARESEAGKTLEEHYSGINIISDAYNLLAEKKASIML